MTAGIVTGLGLCVAGVCAGLAADSVFRSVLEEVNGKLPVELQISTIWVNVELFRVLRLHRHFYLDGSRRIRFWILTALSFTLFFVGVAVLVLSGNLPHL